MFDCRLGVTLGLPLSEVRAMPYPDYHRYELFYMLEPWGFRNDEYRMARQILAIYQSQGAGKKTKVTDLMRDMEKQVIEQLEEQNQPHPDFSDLSDEEKADIIARVKRDFGVRA